MIAALAIILAACGKPLADANIVRDISYFSRDYAALPNDIYYALRFALEECDWPVAEESMKDGLFTTAWLPVASDSHYINTFGRPDYGVTNSYHQLDIHVVPQGGRTLVKVGSRVKTMVTRLESSGKEERRVLDLIGDYLRKKEPALTNLGINE